MHHLVCVAIIFGAFTVVLSSDVNTTKVEGRSAKQFSEDDLHVQVKFPSQAAGGYKDRLTSEQDNEESSSNIGGSYYAEATHDNQGRIQHTQQAEGVSFAASGNRPVHSTVRPVRQQQRIGQYPNQPFIGQERPYPYPAQGPPPYPHQYPIESQIPVRPRPPHLIPELDNYYPQRPEFQGPNRPSRPNTDYYPDRHEPQGSIYDLQKAIPGTPGQDYPILAWIPKTGFKCDASYPGFYADVNTGCQVWHYCQLDGRQDSFLCPNGTMFNQKVFVCDWWYNVDCQNSQSYYPLNGKLYREEHPRQRPHENIRPGQPRPYPGGNPGYPRPGHGSPGPHPEQYPNQNFIYGRSQNVNHDDGEAQTQ